MIDKKALLADLQPLVAKLFDDLLVRLDEHEPSRQKVDSEWRAARAAGRSAGSYEAFREDWLTQVAVAWVLASVFVRFVEDNGLCDEPFLAGSGSRLARARDRYDAWIRAHPLGNDREYLLELFAELGKLPGLRALLGEDGHSLVWQLGPTADGARSLRQFWLTAAADGAVRHDFRDETLDTRFLGDLYQDLSEHAQKQYALLQTPEFIEEFILDRTLGPAIAEFGLEATTLIDPACGSGHFLLGAFSRLFEKRRQREPQVPVQVHAQRALAAVAGVDLNPFAVAIARFRLLVAALKVCGVRRLRDAFDFRPMVVNGDSLLHTVKMGDLRRQGLLMEEEESALTHYYVTEDCELLRSVFGRSYHVVVGNPPYIEPKEKAVKELHRARFGDVCHGRYHLDVPFAKLFFELARPGIDERRAPGFVGYITSNAFMKREFGVKLVEEYLAKRVEVTHILDLSGAYIPGHGTPTTILFGRPRMPASAHVRAVLGIRGEPGTPENPALGVVWRSIVELIDQPGAVSFFVSSEDAPRERYSVHPWCIGGGGACDLKDEIEERFGLRVRAVAEDVGITSVTGEDDVYLLPGRAAVRRSRIEQVRPVVTGDEVRDWSAVPEQLGLWVYRPDFQLMPLADVPATARYLWPIRAAISRRKRFGVPMLERGMSWFEWQELYDAKLRSPLTITYAEVATHNHFVLDRGGKVFKQTAPVIKLPAGASEEEHLGLLGILNSSTACFWLQQVCHNKGGPGGGSSKDEKWHDFFAFNASNVQALPLPDGRPLELARLLDGAATTLRENEPSAVLARAVFELAEFEAIRRVWEATRERMVFLQEELDWRCYRLYGLIEDDLCYSDTDVAGIHVGERAFEIALARQVAAATVETEWFDWLHVTPCTEPPAQWPASYRALVQRRISAIESNRDLALLEQMQCKRRWEAPSWGDLLARAQRDWLLDRMEDPRHWPGPELISTARFADRLQRDTEFLRVAELYVHPKLLDLEALVRELVEGEGVPFLAALRYKPAGLRKRAAWERTWELQRQEDAIDARVALPERDPQHLSPEQAQAEKARVVGAIDVPPKYAKADFLKSSSWRLRGKLDVPKERFVLYPHAEAAGDTSPVFTWAGFDHLQQGQALGAWLNERRERDAWTPAQCVPLLAGLQELLPWIRQWHDEPSAEFGGLRMGEYFQDFLAGQLRQLGLRVEQLVEWRPPARRGRGQARAAQIDTEDEETDA